MSIHPEQHPLDGKLEPETKDCFNDRAPLYSIAISLKRIADAPSEAAARIAELEGDLKAAFREISKLAREAGEATGRLAMSEAAGIVDGWRERAERAEARCRALENASHAEPSGRRTDRAFSLLGLAEVATKAAYTHGFGFREVVGPYETDGKVHANFAWDDDRLVRAIFFMSPDEEPLPLPVKEAGRER